MNCRELMTKEVQWIYPNNTVAQAAHVMEARNVGWLPICRDDLRPIGVLTDRDIAVRLAARDRSAGLTRVEEIMTAPIRFVRQESPAAVAYELMQTARLKRLPVLDGSGRLQGVIALADVMAKGATDPALASSWEGSAGEAARAALARTPVRTEEEQAEIDAASGATAEPQGPDQTPVNPARTEAEDVVSGRGNPLKEFPS